MKLCEREPEIIVFTKNGQMSKDLANHVESCAVCSEVLRTAQSLLAWATVPFDSSLPSAASVWWRTALLKRQRIKRRLVWGQRIAYVTAFILFLLLGTLYLPNMHFPAALLADTGFVALAFLPFAVVLSLWSLRLTREQLYRIPPNFPLSTFVFTHAGRRTRKS